MITSKYKSILLDSQNGKQTAVKDILPWTTKVEQVGINKCIKFFEDRNATIVPAPNRYHPEWDLKVDGVGIEVKTSLEAETTHKGHFFVEYLEKGKKSGISLTEAKYYWLSATNDYLIPTDILKAYGRKSSTRKGVKGGINSTATGFILKAADIQKYKLNL